VWLISYFDGVDPVLAQSEGELFTLTHCLKDLKICPGYQESYATYKKSLLVRKHVEDWTVIDLDEAPSKDVSNENREERKCQEKEEQAMNYINVQKMKRDTDEANAR
jgi:hypothetical protein